MTTAIGITVGLFNVYQAITGAALPLDEGDRVVSLMVWDTAAQTTRGVAQSDLERWQQSLRSVVNLGAFRTIERNLAVGNRQVEAVSVAEIPASGFDVARVPPLLGRPIRTEDEHAGAEPVVVIGHDVWASMFGSDRDVTGRTVRLDGVSHTVIGVMDGRRPDTGAQQADGALVIVSRVGKHLQAGVRLPNGNPFWLDLSRIQPETLLFAVTVAALAAGIVGLVPALQAVGRLTDTAALGGRSTLKLGAAWTGLVALQVALSIAVIPVAGQLAWGIIRPAVTGPGFAAGQFLTARVTLGQGQNSSLVHPGDVARFEQLQTRFAGRLQGLPEVAMLTRSAVAPGREPRLEIEVEGGSASQHAPARVNAVDPTFFETFDMGVVAERIFDRTRGRTEQVVVSRALARHLAGDGSPVGWRLRDSPRSDAPPGSGSWQEIVGVVDDLYANNGDLTVYRPLPENQHPLSLSMRLTTGQPQMAQRLRDLGAEIDAGLYVSEIRSLADVYEDSHRSVYLVGLMLGSGALSVLLLSAAGTYALMSFTVARRRREIAIRAALGGRSTRLLVGVLGRAAQQIGIGAVDGVLLALWLGNYLPIEAIGGARLPGLISVAAVAMTIVGLLAGRRPGSTCATTPPDRGTTR